MWKKKFVYDEKKKSVEAASSIFNISLYCNISRNNEQFAKLLNITNGKEMNAVENVSTSHIYT